LALATATRIVLFETGTGHARAIPLAGVSVLAYSGKGRLAAVRDRTVVELGPEGVQTVFTAPGRLRGLAWAPNGRWLLTTLPGADQWLFVGGGPRVVAVSNIARQFGGTPALDGWTPGA
jgi:hypothetical protein